MFDVKAVEKEAQAEIADEQSKRAKGLIKEKLRAIAAAEKAVANLKAEYAELLRDVGSA